MGQAWNCIVMGRVVRRGCRGRGEDLSPTHPPHVWNTCPGDLAPVTPEGSSGVDSVTPLSSKASAQRPGVDSLFAVDSARRQSAIGGGVVVGGSETGSRLRSPPYCASEEQPTQRTGGVIHSLPTPLRLLTRADPTQTHKPPQAGQTSAPDGPSHV